MVTNADRDKEISALKAGQTTSEAFDDAQNVAIAEAEEVLKSFDPTPPPLNPAVGAEQRLKIYVPTPGGESQGTTMALGAALDAVSHTGFGVATFGHITMDARDPASQMILKAEGEVLVQSATSQLYLLSTMGAMLASADTTSVLANKGITIAAGFEPNAPWTGVAGPNPLNRNADDYRIAMGKITASWGERDGKIAIANMVRSGVLDSCGTGVFDKLWAGFCGYVTEQDRRASPQVTIHAPEGFLLGTDRFGAIYADQGIDVAGAWTGMMALFDAEVVGGKSASLVGGHEATVSALWEASVVSWAGNTAIASRHADVEVFGKNVKIGSRVPAVTGLRKIMNATQKPTQETTIEATKRVVLATTDTGTLFEGINLVSHGVIHQKAETNVNIEAGSEVELKLKDGSARVELFKSRVTIEAGDACVQLHGKNGLAVSLGTGAVFVKNGEIGIGILRQLPSARGKEMKVLPVLDRSQSLKITSGGICTLMGNVMTVKK